MIQKASTMPFEVEKRELQQTPPPTSLLEAALMEREMSGDEESGRLPFKGNAPKWKPSTHEILIMLCLSLISFMVALDACVIVTALPTIVTALGGTTTQSFWIGTSYLLSCAVTMPCIAGLSDIFGRPICLMSSLVLFTVGSIMCAVAESVLLMLAGRCVQGVGGGGILILSLVIFTDIVPLRFRPKWYGTVLGAWALGNCLGPVLGGVIAEHTTWRWVFYIMFPMCAVGFVTLPFLLTLAPKTETLREKLMRVDWVGGLLFISSAASFLVAVTRGGDPFPWSDVRILVPLLLGIFGLIAVFVWEAKFAVEPFLRSSLFYNATTIVTFVCGCIQGIVIYGQLYYVPFYFLSVKEYSPVTTGLALFPTMFTLLPGSIMSGCLISRLNSYRWVIWLGWILTTIGSGVMVLWDADTSIAVWAVTLVVLGFGHGAVLNAQNFATQASCKPREEGAAAAMYAFLRQLGTALGVGIGATVFQNVMKVKLIDLGLEASASNHAEAAIRLIRSGVAEKEDLVEAFLFGFRGVFALFVALSCLAFFLTLFIRHYDLNKELQTDHTLCDSRLALTIQGTIEETKGRIKDRRMGVSIKESNTPNISTPTLPLPVRTTW